jgi:hypothetical protein
MEGREGRFFPFSVLSSSKLVFISVAVVLVCV